MLLGKFPRRSLLVGAGVRAAMLAVVFVRVLSTTPGLSAAEPEAFASEVKPILEAHCVRCHAGPEPKGGLRLTTRDELLAGGDSGPAVLLDAPRDSLLLSAINYDGFEMPPTGKLPQAKIDVLTRWVQGGLDWPAGAVIAPPAAHHGAPQVNEETRSHWAFRPVVRPEPPVDPLGWGGAPIDAFVAARLAEHGLAPASPAEPRALIRRLTYDLTGLPPTLDDVEQFAADPSPAAYEERVDRLLASPQFGEHWARQWLDVVRYAETNSFERDNPKPFVWRYRDYVIRAFNEDRPYDRFILEQLAGDELDDRTADSLIATGYYRLGLWDDEPADPELAFYEGLDDIIATTGQAFLGLTLNCARCHDHKLDPLPQADYYRFLAFFRNVRHYGERADETVAAASLRSIASPDEQARTKHELDAHAEQVKGLAALVAAVEDDIGARLVGGEKDDFKSQSVRPSIIEKHVGTLLTSERFTEYREHRRRLEDLRRNPPSAGELALCVTEHGAEAPKTHVLQRGSPQAPGDEVQPGFPEVLSPPAAVVVPPATGDSTGRRLALARWIASSGNPLTARVFVNRLWQGLFGRGIVRSSNNFGLQGDAPTHPLLLDWLAAELVSEGWRMKPLVRRIVLSKTYQQSSLLSAAGRGVAGAGAAARSAGPDPMIVDPQNDLLWRHDPRRLKAEELRDSMLAASGTLNTAKMYGPSVYVKIAAEVLAGQSRPGSGWGRSAPEDERRRSIYIHIKRSLAVPLLASFDVADTDSTCPVRFSSTQPTQALSLLNSEFAIEQADLLAAECRKSSSDLPGQVRRALERVRQRPATDADVERGVRLIDELREADGLSPELAFRNFCLLALNLNEFVFLD